MQSDSEVSGRDRGTNPHFSQDVLKGSSPLKDASNRVPPGALEMDTFFSRWKIELATSSRIARKARNYAATKLMSQVGLRISEVLTLDIGDVKWGLGRVGKLHVRYGKGAQYSGPRQRMVPLLNGADETLRWYLADVRALFPDNERCLSAPLFPSVRRNGVYTCCRLSSAVLVRSLALATDTHLPEWSGRLTPHVLRHYFASQLYLNGVDPHSIREMLGHSWLHTTTGYIHVPASYSESAWTAGHERSAHRLSGLVR
jgi:integrase/recombinase XerD